MEKLSDHGSPCTRCHDIVSKEDNYVFLACCKIKLHLRCFSEYYIRNGSRTGIDKCPLCDKKIKNIHPITICLIYIRYVSFLSMCFMICFIAIVTFSAVAIKISEKFNAVIHT